MKGAAVSGRCGVAGAMNAALESSKGRVQMVRIQHDMEGGWWLLNVYKHTAGKKAG